jgi:hypothetical protein
MCLSSDFNIQDSLKIFRMRRGPFFRIAVQRQREGAGANLQTSGEMEPLSASYFSTKEEERVLPSLLK